MWPGITAGQLWKCSRKRRIHATGRTEQQTVYGITSIPYGQAPPKQLLKLIRDHWRIENRQHCVLDCTFREDLCRARSGNSPLNLAALRRLALNILRAQGRRVIPDAMADFASSADFAERWTQVPVQESG